MSTASIPALPESPSPLPAPSRFAMTRADYFRPASYAFWAIHLVAIGAIFYVGFSLRGLALAVGVYFARMFVVTAAYHRYFSHRAFKTSRWFQFVLALGAQSAAQKGVLWWASHHRWHHKYSDLEPDVHSARLRGFWYSHIGWILSPHWNATDESRVSDLAKFPGAALPQPQQHLPPARGRAGAAHLSGRRLATASCWGFFVSTVMLWHGSFSINSLSHLFGRALRDHRRLAQQLGARAPHHRRGLAQQPPPLPELGQSGLPLVGDRRDLLRAAPDRRSAASSGTCAGRRPSALAGPAREPHALSE